MTAPDLAAIVAELTPHDMTLEEECRAREAFDYALRMRLHHLQAKVRSLSIGALRDVLLSTEILSSLIEATIAQRAVAESILTPDAERSSSPEAGCMINDRIGAIA
jgi:hypothetical protein